MPLENVTNAAKLYGDERAAAATAPLQQTIDSLNTQIAAMTEADRVEDLGFQENITALKAEVARLQAVIDASTPATTLFGVTVGGGVKKSLPDLHDDVKISRVFGAGTSNWANEGQHKAFPNGKWAVSNSYSLSEAALPNYLATIPAEDKKKIVAYADGHELENPDKGLKPADVKARGQRTAKVIRAAGLRPAFCLMQWTLAPASGRNWQDWVDPNAFDVFAWDVYNMGAKQDTYSSPANMLSRIVEISKTYNKPFQIWETGTDNFGTQAARVAWTKELKAEIVKQKAECAIWFDRPSTSGSTWDATLDRPTAEAWLL